MRATARPFCASRVMPGAGATRGGRGRGSRWERPRWPGGPSRRERRRRNLLSGKLPHFCGESEWCRKPPQLASGTLGTLQSLEPKGAVACPTGSPSPSLAGTPAFRTADVPRGQAASETVRQGLIGNKHPRHTKDVQLAKGAVASPTLAGGGGGGTPSEAEREPLREAPRAAGAGAPHGPPTATRPEG